MDKLDLQFYLDIGKYDIPEIIPLVKDFVSILNVKNYQVTYKVWHEGHSWGNWRDHLSLPLRQFFPPKTGFKENSFEKKINLYQNFPNPFRNQTRIEFTAPVSSNVELNVYNESGKRIQTLYHERLSCESNSISFTNPYLAEGFYIYSLRVDNVLLSKKMNISY